jgi:uncharacterized protein with NRDE domain
MCLVLLWYGAHPDADLLLAGNRDELYRRPSVPPAVIARDPLVCAGRDLEGGGTWMGRNEAGLVAAITNRHGVERPVPRDVRSRGEIVLRVLQHRGPEAAAEWVAALPLARYRAFNLLFGSARALYYFSSEEGQPPRLLARGFHALSNSSLDDRSWPKVARAHRFAGEHQDARGETLLADLQRFLADRTPPDSLAPRSRDEEIHGALGAVFIETPDYGTVSSTILTLGGRLGDRYYYAEGTDMRRAAGNPGMGAFRMIDCGP